MAAASIGIDLGTTFSVVATAAGGGAVEVIPNEHGKRTTPSVVLRAISGGEATTDAAAAAAAPEDEEATVLLAVEGGGRNDGQDDELVVGEVAAACAAKQPRHVARETKRLVGTRREELPFLTNWKGCPISLAPDGGVALDLGGDGTCLQRPQDIARCILRSLKASAEAYFSTNSNKRKLDAVITVPAHFGDRQRQITKDAGIEAGLNVLRIINEHTAAAIAYGFGGSSSGESTEVTHKHGSKKLLVFDFGGGTLDVTLLDVDDIGLFEVLSTGGDPYLGGMDVDEALAQHFEDSVPGLSDAVRLSDRCRARLQQACERIKCNLSRAAQATAELELPDGRVVPLALSRARFEALCQPLFERAMAIVEQVLVDAPPGSLMGGKGDVDEVILVGGSSRIPKVQDLLRAYFPGREPRCSLDPDEVVAMGAAILARSLVAQNEEVAEYNSRFMVVLDVTPKSIGVETEGSVMSVLIPRNTTVPCEVKQSFSTTDDGQTSVTIRIFEGERVLTRDCELLGEFELLGLPADAKRGEPRIELALTLDESGVLTVSATAACHGEKKKKIQEGEEEEEEEKQDEVRASLVINRRA